MAKPLLQFKAGKVVLDEQSLEATPKRGQGMVRVFNSPDDPLLYSFTWEPRGNHVTVGGEAESKVELLLFPGDAKWVHVPQCKSGRVFALKFRSGGPPHVFWMQSKGDEDEVAKLTREDESIATKMDNLLKESEEEEEEEEIDMQEAAACANANVNANANAGASASADTTTPADADVEMEDDTRNSNQSNLNIPSNVTEAIRQMMAGNSGRPMSQQIGIRGISDAISSEELIRYVNGVSDEEVARLCEDLPAEIPHTREWLCKVIYSSYFQQGMSSLSQVLNTSGLGSIVASQLEYDYEGQGVEGMLQGIRKRSKKEDRK